MVAVQLLRYPTSLCDAEEWLGKMIELTTSVQLKGGEFTWSRNFRVSFKPWEPFAHHILHPY